MFASFSLKDDYYIRLYRANFVFFLLGYNVYINPIYNFTMYLLPLLKTIDERITGLGNKEMGFHSLIATNFKYEQTKESTHLSK